MTHTTQEKHRDYPELVGLSASFHLMVDRNNGGTVNCQWRQDRGSVVMTGVYISAVNILKVLDGNISGWSRFCKENLRMLRDDPCLLADD